MEKVGPMLGQTRPADLLLQRVLQETGFTDSFPLHVLESPRVFFQAEDGIRYLTVNGVQTCALPILEVPLGETTVRAAVWRARVGRVPLSLLDTDIGSNPPELRGITDRLYVPEPQRRLPQEMVLEIGRASCRERV